MQNWCYTFFSCRGVGGGGGGGGGRVLLPVDHLHFGSSYRLKYCRKTQCSVKTPECYTNTNILV